MYRYKNIQLSEHFWLSEFVKSQTATRHGIDNMPKNQQTVNNIKSLVTNILQPLRWAYDRPLIITSGYRCLELNRKIGSKDTSQHISGQAADFEMLQGVTNLELAEFIRDNFHFDQIILEFFEKSDPYSGWVHCSYVNEVSNRNQCLTINRNGVFNGFQSE